jgi:nickel-type superoxide dismutase maturation protease
MEPTLRPGDWLIVWRGASIRRQAWPSRPGSPGRAGGAGCPVRIKAGQIVVARHPGRPDMLLVKRAARRESGGWWLESDNPDVSAVDSRRFGLVSPELIEGRVLTRYWPALRPERQEPDRM